MTVPDQNAIEQTARRLQMSDWLEVDAEQESGDVAEVVEWRGLREGESRGRQRGMSIDSACIELELFLRSNGPGEVREINGLIPLLAGAWPAFSGSDSFAMSSWKLSRIDGRAGLHQSLS